MRVLTPSENKRLNELIGFVGLSIAILLALSLLSYSPSDPSLNVSASAPNLGSVHNWIGLVGAYLADALFQLGRLRGVSVSGGHVYSGDAVVPQPADRYSYRKVGWVGADGGVALRRAEPGKYARRARIATCGRCAG